MKSGTKLVVLVVAAVIAGQLFLRSGDAPDRGEPAPDLALTDLAGRRVDLAELKGRVVAVNFWATWCGPCREELPELAEFWRVYNDRCFELLGVAEQSGHQDVVAMAKDVPYPILIDGRADLLEPWGVGGFPFTYVVDAEGKVRHVFRGVISKEQLAEAVDPLLPATCPKRS